VDRKFFDRSGWEELHEVESRRHLRNAVNLYNIQSFIDKNYIQPAIPDHDAPSVEMQSDVEDNDESIVTSEDEDLTESSSNENVSENEE